MILKLVVEGKTTEDLVNNLRKTADALAVHEPVVTSVKPVVKSTKKAAKKKAGRPSKAAKAAPKVEEVELEEPKVEAANKHILDAHEAADEEADTDALLGAVEEPTTTTKDQVRAAAQGLIKLAEERKKDPPAVLASVLRKFNAEALSELSPEHYAGFVSTVDDTLEKYK